jgi:flagella basal body P-ring formation protein FlgA
VLAKPGTPATLVMLGQNMRITTTVDPLQPGIRGQCILVRDPATARVMTAEVVDEGLLQISF